MTILIGVGFNSPLHLDSSIDIRCKERA